MPGTTKLALHIVTDADPKGRQQVSDGTKKLKVDASDLSNHTKRVLGILPGLPMAPCRVNIGKRRSSFPVDSTGRQFQETRCFSVEVHLEEDELTLANCSMSSSDLPVRRFA
jgi:hypothetical protein